MKSKNIICNEKTDTCDVKEVIYTCPMHPEIKEHKPGNCPKCGMALERDTPIIQNTGVKYTCPMHPEVVSDRPGSCPKCGMALEPVTIDQENEDNELSYMSKRFWISTFLSIPIFLIAMIADLYPDLLPNNISMSYIQWFEFIFATPVVLWGGWPFFVRGYNSIKTLNLNMFTLIAIGVGAAYLYSIVALVFPEIFPPLMRDKNGLVSVYFEAAAVITTLVLLGQVLELKARSKTNSSLKALLNLAPKKAHLIDGHNEKEISLDEVKVGDLLRVKPGEKIPVDGLVVDGKTNIDESMITGEPIAISKKSGDKVIGATINKNGTIVIKAEKVGSDTMLSQIIDMVSKAQRSRAPIQNLADKVSAYFVPAVIVSAILAFIAWYMYGPEPRLAYAVVALVAVLIIACPCALGLATPISIMVSTGRAALMGILVKDAKTLEVMRKVNVIVVDKTGTVTEGKPRVTDIISSGKININDIVRYGASVEKVSEHPLSDAIVQEALDRKIELLDVSDFHSITGKGVSAKVGDKKVILGSKRHLEDFGIHFEEDTKSLISKYQNDGKGVIFIAIDQEFVGFFIVEDPIKRGSKEAISSLQKMDIDIVMISGDNKITAENIGKKTGITKVYADVMPDMKMKIVQKLKDDGNIVAMAGDGINDAPALATADVGISMGGGTDVAIESSDITLIKGNLLGILKIIKLSHHTMRNIKQNLFFAFIYNSIGVPVAAGVLYPYFGILLSPIIAAAAMSFSSVSVIVNALRLKNIKM